MVDKWLDNYVESGEQSQSKFLSLPKEILLNIYEKWLTRWDAIRLSITCRYLLAFFRDALDDERDLMAANWFCCRVAIVGDYARYSDLPRHFLNDTSRREVRIRILAAAKEERAMRGVRFTEVQYSSDDSSTEGRGKAKPPPNAEEEDLQPTPRDNIPFPRGGREPSPAPLDWVPHAFGSAPKADRKELDEASFGGLDLLCENKGNTPYRGLWMSPELLAGLEEEDQMRYTELGGCFYPGAREWYLFNTCKGVYVRARALAELCGFPDDEQPFLPQCRLDLGHVLLLRACWSMDPSAAMCTDELDFEIHRGPWAGDGFLITCMMKEVKESFPKFKWRDVSEEVVRDLKAVCHANMGKRWEEYIKERAPEMASNWFYYASDNPSGVGRAARWAGASLMGLPCPIS